jgi:hypothetical protein
MKVVRIEDRANITQRMSGDRGDLSLSAFCDRESSDGSAPQIVEGNALDAGGDPSLTKGRSKPVGRPGPSIGVQQHPLAAWFGRVKNLFQRRSYGNYDARAGLRLLQAYAFAVIGVPGETQQVALPLTGPQRN